MLDSYAKVPWAAAAAAAARAEERPSEVEADRLNYLHPGDFQAQRELLQFLRENGATVRFRPQDDCLTCPRGALATENIQAGDVVLRLPFSLRPYLSIPKIDKGEAAVFAKLLLLKSDPGPSFFRRQCTSLDAWLIALWLRAQPNHRRGVAFAVQTLATKHIDEAMRTNSFIPDVWVSNACLWEGYRDFKQSLSVQESVLLNYEAYRDAAAAYATRVHVKIGTMSSDLSDYKPAIFLTPGMEMIDIHASQSNVALGELRFRANETFEIKATEYIPKGREIRLAPYIDAMLQPDTALRRMGWLPDEEPPIAVAFIDTVSDDEVAKKGLPSTWDDQGLQELLFRYQATERMLAGNLTTLAVAMDAVLTRDGRLRMLKLMG